MFECAVWLCAAFFFFFFFYFFFRCAWYPQLLIQSVGLGRVGTNRRRGNCTRHSQPRCCSDSVVSSFFVIAGASHDIQSTVAWHRPPPPSCWPLVREVWRGRGEVHRIVRALGSSTTSSATSCPTASIKSMVQWVSWLLGSHPSICDAASSPPQLSQRTCPPIPGIAALSPFSRILT